jgi:hypothetical protein
LGKSFLRKNKKNKIKKKKKKKEKKKKKKKKFKQKRGIEKRRGRMYRDSIRLLFGSILNGILM